jgi:AcrR family transcriptional regulator
VVVVVSHPHAQRALELARAMFLAQERVDMQAIAAELGVSRTTLFRWVGTRDQLLGEVLWSVGQPTFARARERATATGARGVAQVMGLFVQELIDSPGLWAFVRASPERALRVLTTKASFVQLAMVAEVEQLLRQEVARGTMTPALAPPDLAYLLVRIAESYVYCDAIAGGEPSAIKAETAIAALLGVDWAAEADLQATTNPLGSHEREG